jgi:hypothetical protein
MKENLIETIEYRGHKIEVYADPDPQNPITDWDMLGKFICFHKRYDLSNDKRFKDPDEVREYAKENKCRLYPLYLYDHSGITIRLHPFSCPWDSGQVGWVMLEPEDLRKEYSVKRLTKKHWEKAEKVIECEVKTFDDYLVGRVYGFKAYDLDGDDFDSCWGYFGDTDEMIAEVKLAIDKEVDSFEFQPSEQEGAYV